MPSPIIPCLIGILAPALLAPAALAEDRPNVLLLLVDDLKPALGCYGDRSAKSPHIDALAARGVVFDRAYCNMAVCAASRFSLLLGSLPTRTGLYALGDDLRKKLPEAVTLPQYFARHGYRTESLGKVFHIGHGNPGDPAGFSVPHFADRVIEYRDPAHLKVGTLTREEALFANRQLGGIAALPRGQAFESPVIEDDGYADGRVAAETQRRLRAARDRREKEGSPFFIAAGFARPHLPFSVPKRYWDLHDPNKLPQPELESPPVGAPAVALKRGGEIAAYEPVPPDGRIGPELRRSLIHGYYASVSYVDAQIGRVLDALDELDLAKNTIVVLWGDHGFHLGDLGLWTKHTNYEQATRIPLIIAAPGIAPERSGGHLAVVESVDVYPTLAELAGLPAPEVPQGIDGLSLVPFLEHSHWDLLAEAGRHEFRDHAFHVFPRGRKLGRAIRTGRYRLVEWKTPSAPDEEAEYELYDYLHSPVETRNLAKESPAIFSELKAILDSYPDPK